MSAYVQEMRRIFRSTPDKREAHARCVPVLDEIAGDTAFLRRVFSEHILTKGCLNTKLYPVLGFTVTHNPHFSLVVNCWIPHPERRADISTKAVHHHGELLLTTVTSFGPGYEHWLFSLPEPVNPDEELFRTRLLDRAPHPLRHSSFVDSYTCHLPIVPSSMSITLALWSTSTSTTWRDYLKTVAPLQRNSARLRRIVAKLGLAKALELKLVQYFDFYPAERGFIGMKDRIEFDRGPNEDYLWSLFHVLQETQNEALVPDIEALLDGNEPLENRELVRRLVRDLDAGNPIPGRLSPGHYDAPYANFTTAAIERALAAQG